MSYERLEPLWLKTREAEERLQVSKTTLIRMTDQGVLDYGVHWRKGFGTKGHLAWNIPEIERVLNARKPRTATTPE
jgi:hypothetical protein